MATYQRRSSVIFSARPVKKEARSGWEVILEYEDEQDRNWLIDMSHISKWDIQNSHLADMVPWGERIPENPGDCLFKDGTIICRMNPTQAMVLNLLDKGQAMPNIDSFTDVTDSYALLAILGKDVHFIMEKITALDLFPPQKRPPFLIQGPILHVGSKTVALTQAKGLAAILMAFPRGFGQSMSDAILSSGRQWDLRPAGENRFRRWL